MNDQEAQATQQCPSPRVSIELEKKSPKSRIYFEDQKGKWILTRVDILTSL